MDSDGMLEGIYYIVLGIGLVFFGSIVLWGIYTIGVLVTRPSRPDVGLLGLLIFIQVFLFIFGLCSFIYGYAKGSRTLREEEEKKCRKYEEAEKRPKGPCRKCRGTRKCSDCRGKGKKAVLGELITCKRCEGTGVCSYCKED